MSTATVCRPGVAWELTTSSLERTTLEQAQANRQPADAGDRGTTKAVPPCHRNDPDLWFADAPADLERAKQLCVGCPIRRACLAGALERAEPWGVWGGEILERGEIIARKRPRGRPRKNIDVSAQSSAA